MRAPESLAATRWSVRRLTILGLVGRRLGDKLTLGSWSGQMRDLCVTDGDSGAPIFSYNRARGLLKGANKPDPGQDPWVPVRTGSTRASPRPNSGCTWPPSRSSDEDI